MSSGTSPYVYQWLQRAPGAGSYLSISGATSSSYSFVTSGSTASGTWSFELQVTDAAGAPPVTSSAVSVVVNSALVAPTVSASVGVVSQGQTSVLSSSAVSSGTSPYVYQWLQRAPGAGSYLSISGATSSSYSFVTSGSTASGTWSFELQVTDGVSAVVTSNAVSVTVNEPVAVVVSPSAWVMDVGQSKTFTATASGGSGSYPASGYHWYVDGSVQSGQTVSTFSYSPGSAGSYSITVTVTDSSGTTSAQSPAASVTVNTSPIVTIVPVGPLTMNAGQNQTFTATSSGGSDTIHYQWYVDSSTVGSDNASYSYVATGTSHSVTCKVTDSASIPVTSPVSNAVSVTVNPTLAAPNISASVLTINQGQTSSLTSTTVSTGTSPYTYQWLQKAPGGSYAAVGSNSPSFNFVTSGSIATGSWSFILQVRDSVGASVNSSAVSVTVNIAPLDHFIFSSVGVQTAGVPFTITITAKNAYNSTLTNFSGTNILSVSTGTINPATTGVFSNGVWTGAVMVTGAGSGIWLITSGSGMSGTSDTFSVNPGVFDHFFFSSVDDQVAGSSFGIVVIAKDIYNNTATSYNGSPSLICSAGAINPNNMDAFVNGVGSTSVTVASAGSSVTITATEGSRSVTSNVFRVTNAPTATPTITPTTPPHQTATSTPSSTSNPTTTNGPTPSSTPNPADITLKTLMATAGDGSSVYINISGNIIDSNISNVDISSDQIASRTTLSLTLIGPSGTYSFCNITIPKNAVTFGKAPTVYVNSQLADYDYNQDANNYYVWYTTYSNTYELIVTFTETSGLQLWSAVLIAVISVILVVVIVIPRITGKSLSLKTLRSLFAKKHYYVDNKQ